MILWVSDNSHDLTEPVAFLH